MTDAAVAPDVTPKNAVDRMVVGIAKALSVTYALSIVVTIFDVGSDVLATPTIWVYESSFIVTASAFMLGRGYALYKGAHVRTDI